MVKTKPGEDAMAGYNWQHHQSPDRNYVPGYGQKAAGPRPSVSSASSPSTGTKRDSLSNLWHLYAKNHSAEPYTEYHKAHNANIFNHVKEHYGVEVAKAMHGHAEALRQGHIYSIRKKYNISEDLENKDKPKSTKELARKYIARFRDQKVRNRKRLKKISKIYESVLDAQGEQKFNELKEHPYVKSHFIGDWYKTSYGDNHHAFQTREHTSLKNGSKHELRAAVRPNGDHEVTLLSHHKTKNEFASGRGVGKSWDEAINKARAEHTKSLDLAAGGIKAHPRAHVKVRKEMDDLEH